MSNCSEFLPAEGYPTSSDFNKGMGIFLPIFTWSYVLVSTIFYLKEHRSSSFLKKRQTALILTSSFGICILAIFPIREFVGRERFPCVLTELIPFVSLGLFAFPVVVRALHYYWRIQFNRKLAKSAFAKDALASKQVQDAAAVTDTEILNQTMVELRTAKFLASKTWAYFLQLMFTLAFVVAALILSKDRLDCLGCENNEFSFYAQVVFAAILLGTAATGLRLVRKEPDPLGINQEVKALYIIGFFGLVLNLCLESIDPADVQADGKWFWNYILVMALIGCQTVLMPLQIYNARKLVRKRRTSSLSDTASGNRRNSELDLLLDSEVGREYFKSHLVNELSIENYFFWRDVNAWKEEGCSAEGAKYIYDVYIANNSTLEINISGVMHNDIEKKIKLNQIEPSIFDEAYKTIVVLMETNAFPRFKKSSLYKQWSGTEGSDPNLNMGAALPESI